MGVGSEAMSDKYTDRQLAASAAAGMTALGAWRLAGLPWLAVWLGLAIAAGILLIIWSATRGADSAAAQIKAAFGLWPARILLVLESLWLAVVLGWLAARSAEAFPGQNMFPTVGIILLLLVYSAVRHAGGVMARCGAVCFLVLALLYTGVLAFAVPDLHWTWLAPVKADGGSVAKTAAFCLLPAAGLLVGPEGDSRVRGAVLWGLAFLAAIPVLVTASLGGTLTAVLEQPFYIMVQNISILGVMERFEGVICAAEQVGAFCLMGLLTAAGSKGMASVWESRWEKWYGAGLLVLAVPAMWLPEAVGEQILLTGSAIFCGLLPLFTLSVVKLKKMRKNEKSVDKGGRQC